MHSKAKTPDTDMLQLWGGLECTINRVHDRYHSQLDQNGHARRADDIDRFASLGIRAIRYPVLWEQIAPAGLERADWSMSDERLQALRDRNVTPILGLVHHGSGPRHTSLVDPDFATGLARYAAALAARYPWAEYYTVVNEPLTTARFACLYGLWYPHARSDTAFLRALLVQCKATVLSMQAIRAVNPAAKLVQTDDLGKTYGTPAMQATTEFYNQRRWLGWDLLCGMVGPTHALWSYLIDNGIAPEELAWFSANACPPDLIGVNYYVTSERWLDHRPENYPPCYRGIAGNLPCADIEASRVLAAPTGGIGPLLDEAWSRYRIPIAVTEVHIDANREDQLRWLMEVWEASMQARVNGVDVRAVTVWSLLGAFDWNSLVTAQHGYYESGAFDLRGAAPRPTAIAAIMRQLAVGDTPDHPALHGSGWWRRPARLLAAPVAAPEALASISADRHGAWRGTPAPILITGASGTLGRAFARICKERHLAYRLLGRDEMDIADLASVEAAVARFKPWALINASGYVRVDEAEHDAERCMRENTAGPAILAAVCARQGIHLTTFSSDLVFDGRQNTPYVETDATSPLNVYGLSKAMAEQQVLQAHPGALVVRTSAFFGPWDAHNFVTQALAQLGRGEVFRASDDVTIAPTYVPDLVNCCLDLIIDGERGIWHLSNGTAITWLALARKASEMAGIDTPGLQAQACDQSGQIAARPRYSALGSTRGHLLPSLESALERFAEARRAALAAAETWCVKSGS
ncbi:sugar nucleotide-binding protein [Massilia antarctica]|uniref:dTDP-4-dehydrorhamnose reductase n=1 Tax=Massilia antarctica TaxID=2765360 RepID=A0AA48WBG2_9BURK|nr:family 1 glycosylhydrolase [Massilia antarctica]QPI49388.1 sugar nucleotide-binding protein [Massilia antarctica]